MLSDQLCACGCGQHTNVAQRTYTKPNGHKIRRGDPCKYVFGHQRRKSPVDYIEDDAGCWIWQLYVCKSTGYGMAGGRGKATGAHRFYYEKHKGPIPEGLQIDHLCRNRACVNPEHLEAVSPAENVRRRPDCKLSKEKASEMRRLFFSSDLSVSDLARLYGVAWHTANSAIRGTSWGLTLEELRNELRST